MIWNFSFCFSLPIAEESLVYIRFVSALVCTIVIEVNCSLSIVWPSFYSVMIAYFKAVLITDSFQGANIKHKTCKAQLLREVIPTFDDNSRSDYTDIEQTISVLL